MTQKAWQPKLSKSMLKTLHMIGPTWAMDGEAWNRRNLILPQGTVSHHELWEALMDLKPGGELRWYKGLFKTSQEMVYRFKKKHKVDLKTSIIEGGILIRYVSRNVAHP